MALPGSAFLLFLFLLGNPEGVFAETCTPFSGGSDITAWAESLRAVRDKALGQAVGQIQSSTCERVKVRRNDREVVVSVPADILLGDSVTCEGEGRLEVLFANNTRMSLLARSSIQIEEFLFESRSNPAKLFLSKLGGAVRLNVDSSKSAQDVRVNLPTVAIAVRGTEFEVQAPLSDSSRVVVKTYEGKVFVQHKFTAQSRELKAGESLEVVGNTLYRSDE